MSGNLEKNQVLWRFLQNVINVLSQNEGRRVVLKPIGFGNEKEVYTTENHDLNSFNNQTEEAKALDIFEEKSLHPHASLSTRQWIHVVVGDCCSSVSLIGTIIRLIIWRSTE